jgi:hypothetical protein
VPALRIAGQLFAASSPQNWILSITIPGALIPAILVGSSGDASATALDLSANTVKTHLRHLYRKLGAHSRHEAVKRARAIGLLAISSSGP